MTNGEVTYDTDPVGVVGRRGGEPAHGSVVHHCDGRGMACGHTFALEWKRSGSLGHVAPAIHELQARGRRLPRRVIPVLSVPYMGEAARARCAEAGLSWLDLSGNARIMAPGVFYQNLGQPNLFRRPGRPEPAFGARGARVARHLLMQPSATWRQRALAEAAGLDAGHTSRIVAKLLELGLVKRGEGGIHVPDAGALLDAWRDDYRFDRHEVVRGHIAAASGDQLVDAIARSLSTIEVPYAVTALPAAWLWTRHAGFRLVTVYLGEYPSPAVAEALGFQEEPRGANVWLVVPNDNGVFAGASLVDGVRAVHPVQAYLDLKGHPERSAEAADALRRLILQGGGHDR
ncbi:MAG: hypothetical protein OXC99_02955 [Chloroflexi bacterium]|nr:hypothetical protein [Chloroflexota bacterium]